MARRGSLIQLKFKLGQKGNEGKKRAHFLLVHARERGEERRGDLSFLPRFMEFRGLVFVGPRTKVYCINER